MIRPPLVIPNSLLECEEFPVEPQEPDLPDFDTQFAVFLTQAENAWRDCRDDLREVGELVRAQEGE